MKAEDLWKEYCRKTGCAGEKYEAWAFGGNPDKLAELVISGEKTGTASAYPLYEEGNEPFPSAGDYSVILNEKGDAVCIIRTTKVYVVPFNEVSPDHAFKEGEGDKTLDYWRKVHEEFFTECMGEAGMKFTRKMNVVCEEFELVYAADIREEY